MKEFFGTLPDGQAATLYTISCGSLTASITDLGATLVRLMVPDCNGIPGDVVLGFDAPEGYLGSTTYMGATIGRNSNRVADAAFTLGGREYKLCANEGRNSLHSGPEGFHNRLWAVKQHLADRVTFRLLSPNGDQGFPGNAEIEVTYRLTQDALNIRYEAVCDQDTVFNLTNHSYFNLAGHARTDAAMDQVLTIPGRFFNPDDAESIPTGELRTVAGSPMDFRSPKAIGRDISEDYDALNLQGGYDHNYEVFCQPAAILYSSESGREMAVYTDCPGVQFYAGNFLDDHGKEGVYYHKRSGICLETQYYPDAVHHPEWPQPITPAGEKYVSETTYRFR